MSHTTEPESSWDSLAEELGLPPEPKPERKSEVAAVTPVESVEAEEVEESATVDHLVPAATDHLTATQPSHSEMAPKHSVVEVVVPPHQDTSVVVETPDHVMVSVHVKADHHHDDATTVEVIETHTDADDSQATVDAVEDVEEAETDGDAEAPASSEPGKRKRRRKRRRGRRGSESEAKTEDAEIVSETPTISADDDVEVEDAPELSAEDDETEPVSAVDEEMEAEVSQPRVEWNVVSWVDLVATLYRPER